MDHVLWGRGLHHSGAVLVVLCIDRRALQAGAKHTALHFSIEHQQHRVTVSSSLFRATSQYRVASRLRHFFSLPPPQLTFLRGTARDLRILAQRLAQNVGALDARRPHLQWFGRRVGAGQESWSGQQTARAWLDDRHSQYKEVLSAVESCRYVGAGRCACVRWIGQYRYLAARAALFRAR